MPGLLFPKEVTNSPNICETDLPRRAAWVFAWCTSRSSIRNVSFVFMPYNIAYGIRLVNHLLGRTTKLCFRHASDGKHQCLVRQSILVLIFALILVNPHPRRYRCLCPPLLVRPLSCQAWRGAACSSMPSAWTTLRIVSKPGVRSPDKAL